MPDHAEGAGAPIRPCPALAQQDKEYGSMSIVMALAATLMLAGPGHATPQATAPHAAAGTPTVHPAQADATRNWT